MYCSRSNRNVPIRIAITLILVILATPVFALNVKTGTYTGNGSDSRSITGIGFQPDFVLIRGENTSEGCFKTSSMAGDTAINFAGGGTTANYIQALEADGFQVGTDALVNTNGTIYAYMAIKADATNFAVGSFTGDGAATKSITGLGFQPSGVSIRHNDNNYREPVWKSSSMGGTNSILYSDTVSVRTEDRKSVV